jgi:hypothetical protein
LADRCGLLPDRSGLLLGGLADRGGLILRLVRDRGSLFLGNGQRVAGWNLLGRPRRAAAPGVGIPPDQADHSSHWLVGELGRLSAVWMRARRPTVVRDGVEPAVAASGLTALGRGITRVRLVIAG